MPPLMTTTQTQPQQPIPQPLGGFPLLSSPPAPASTTTAPPLSQPASLFTLPPPPSQPHTITPSSSQPQQQQQQPSLFGSDILDLGNLSLGLNKTTEQPPDPLAVLDNVFVPLDTIQPGTFTYKVYDNIYHCSSVCYCELVGFSKHNVIVHEDIYSTTCCCVTSMVFYHCLL